MPKSNRGGIDVRLLAHVSLPFNQNPDRCPTSFSLSKLRRQTEVCRTYFTAVELVINFQSPIREALALVAEPDAKRVFYQTMETPPGGSRLRAGIGSGPGAFRPPARPKRQANTY